MTFCGLDLAHPVLNGSGTFDAIAARRVFGAALDRALPVRGVRLQDDHAGAAARQPAAAPLRDGRRADQLDRAAQQGAARLPRGGSAGAGLAAGSADHERHGVDGGRGWPRWSRPWTREAQVAAIELNVSCPNVRTGLDIGADPDELARLLGGDPAADGQAADRQAHAEHRRRRARRPGGRGRRGRRRLAHQHPACVRAAPGRVRRGLARRRDGRAVRSGRANRRAGAGQGGRRARGPPDRRHGRSLDRATGT